jgi:hypothetical protein
MVAILPKEKHTKPDRLPRLVNRGGRRRIAQGRVAPGRATPENFVAPFSMRRVETFRQAGTLALQETRRLWLRRDRTRSSFS